MYIYAYRVPALNAVKIGKGNNPLSRMSEYTRQHGLIADTNSLRFWEVGSSVDKIERWLHVSVGLEKLRHGKTLELFRLDQETFEGITSRLERLISTNPHDPVPVTDPPILDFASLDDLSRLLLDWAGNDVNRNQILIMKANGGIVKIDINNPGDNGIIHPTYTQVWSASEIAHTYPNFAGACLGAKITVGGEPPDFSSKLSWLSFGEFSLLTSELEDDQIRELTQDSLKELINKRARIINQMKIGLFSPELITTLDVESRVVERILSNTWNPVQFKKTRLPKGSRVIARGLACIRSWSPNYCPRWMPIRIGVVLQKAMNPNQVCKLMDLAYQHAVSVAKLEPAAMIQLYTLREVEPKVYELDFRTD